MSSTGSKLVKNISFNWAGMAVGMLLGFIQAPIVVHGLGNVWFGIWILVNEIVSYTWLFDLGVREAIVRHVSKHHAQKQYQEINEIVSSAIYLYLLISLLTIVVVSALTALLPYLFTMEPNVVCDARLVLFLSGLNISFNWYFNSYVGILMGLQRFDIFQKIGMGMGVLRFVLTITIIKAGYGIVALSLINITVSVITNAMVYLNCRRLLPEFKLMHYDRKKMRLRQLINYGKYVLLNNFGAKIIYGTDAVIIGIFINASAITYYAIPGTLINMFRNMTASATWVMNPLFSALEANSEIEKLKNIFTKGTKLSFLMGLPIGIVFLFMGKNFISLWMGEDYAEGSAMVLIILTIGTLFTIWENMINSVLYGISRHNIIAWLRIVEAATKIVLCILLISAWGIVGVALANTLSHVLFMGLILPCVVCREVNIPIRTYVRELIIPPLVSCLPFAICCYVLNLYLPATNLAAFFLSIAVAMPIYVVCAWYISFTRMERNEYVKMLCSIAPFLRAYNGCGNIR